MANDKTLFDWVEDRKSMLEEMEQTDFFALPEFVSNNLKYPFFEWQKSALENFVIFDRTSKLKDFPGIKNRPTHLLFNMATGAGKTMMMAALFCIILKKGIGIFCFSSIKIISWIKRKIILLTRRTQNFYLPKRFCKAIRLFPFAK